MWWGDSYMFGGGWMMIGLLLLWILLIITTVAVLISTMSSWRPRPTHSDAAPATIPQSAAPSSARAILDERYARGDITTDDYLERVKHLVG